MSNRSAPRLRYAIFTPSHARDFERCRVLVESVRAYAPGGTHHYVLVERRDERLFSPLRAPRTHVVVTQDILPWWLHQVPFRPKWWLNLKGRPSRGWIIQQIIKLSVDLVTDADVCVFIDSDAFLIKRFEPSESERDGKVPLFRELLRAELPHNTAWHAAAAKLFGLPPESIYRRSYVTNVVTWRLANVTKLHRRIEQTTGRGWVESLCRLETMSEYVLYGVFCERVLGEESGHYVEDTIRTLNYWDDRPLDDGALRAMRERLRSEHVGVMISAKSNTAVAAIRSAFDRRS